MVQSASRPPTILDQVDDLRRIWPGDSPPTRGRTRPPAGMRRRAGLRTLIASHPWLIAGMLVVAAVGAWLALVAAPRYGERLAEDLAGELEAATVSVQRTLPGTRRAAAVISDPAAARGRLGETMEALTTLGAAASDLGEAARRPLPETPPFVPRQGLEALGPLRTNADLLSARTVALAVRLDRVLTYRLAVSEAFLVPPLPVEADTDAVDVLSTDLATMVASAVEKVVSLPTDPLLEGNRQDANAALEDMDAWRTEYLAALRDGDAGEASAAIDRLEASIARWEESLAESLAGVEGWVTAELDAITADMQELTGSTRGR